MLNMEMMNRLPCRNSKRGGRCKKFRNGMKMNKVYKERKRARNKVKKRNRRKIKKLKRIKRKRRKRKKKRRLSRLILKFRRDLESF
jgi:hypothetical protein